MYAAFRVLLLLLVVLPLASALVVWPLRQRVARRVALWLALIHLGVTAAVIAGTLKALEVRNESVSARTDPAFQKFLPEFVPGDPGVGATRTPAPGPPGGRS